MLEPPRQFVPGLSLVTFCVLNSASSRRAKMPKSFNLRGWAVFLLSENMSCISLGGTFYFGKYNELFRFLLHSNE